MREKNRSSKKEAGPRSQEINNFLKEAELEISSWTEAPNLLVSRIEAFSPQELEEIFVSLMKSMGEDVYPFFEALIGRQEKIDLSLAHTLGRWTSPEAGILLHRLASKTSSRAVLKNIRKSIFRLKSQGLGVKEIGDSSPAIYRPPRLTPSEGFVSSLDSVGTRLVWLVRPQLPQGVLAFHALVSDLQGIIDFHGFETSRKRFHEYLDSFKKEAPWDIVEADPDYCLGLMSEAVEINEKREQPPPGDFLKWRTGMGNASPLPLKPLIYLYLNEEEWKSRSDLVDRSGSLFQLPSFQAWFLEEEETKKYLPLLKEASESRLVLNPYQKEARVMDIYRQAVNELFDRERRALYRRRLEEMAYVLMKTGKKSEAQVSLAAALGMESQGGVLSTHPFLLELVKRSLAARLEEEAQKQAKETDLLIKP